MVDLGTTTEFNIRNKMAPMTGSKELRQTKMGGLYGPPNRTTHRNSVPGSRMVT